MVAGYELIAARYAAVAQRVRLAALASQRQPEAVRLMVVTKGQPVEAIQAVIAAGARLIGENYLEEAQPKIAAITEVADLHWHMIGHVQSRKAAGIVENFEMLHSLDSLKLAQRLERFAGDLQRPLTALLECNVSGEQSKFGWQAWDENRWAALAESLAPLLELRWLKIRGLMTMPPYFDDMELARPYFVRLRRLQEYLARCFPAADWSELSMGMSGDFEAAIHEGATIVRVGTAIMGARQR